MSHEAKLRECWNICPICCQAMANGQFLCGHAKEVEGLLNGIADMQAGRVKPIEQVFAEIEAEEKVEFEKGEMA